MLSCKLTGSHTELPAEKLTAAKAASPVQTKEYKAWYAANEHWLKPYAVFGLLRDLFGTAEHWKWGSLNNPSPEVASFHQLQHYKGVLLA